MATTKNVPLTILFFVEAAFDIRTKNDLKSVNGADQCNTFTGFLFLYDGYL